MTSPFGFVESTIAEIAASFACMFSAAPPKTANKISVGIAATIEYLNRVRTTPGTSASCVVAETMVVSDTGAKLSPNTAPAKIAAKSIVGSAPTATPAGNINVQKATVVP